MPPRDTLPGIDDIQAPAYLATDGEASPELAQWKSDHPDWFEAGTWTPGSPRAGEANGRAEFASARGEMVLRVPSPLPPPTDYAALAGPRPLIDPATLSLAEFNAIGSAARAGRPDATGQPPLKNDSSALDPGNSMPLPPSPRP